jgi:hypothetical protein
VGRQLGSDVRRTVEDRGNSRVILISLSIHVLSVFAFFALGRALGIAGIAHYLAIVSCDAGDRYPDLVGGWGTREGALVIGFGLLSVELERAFAWSATLASWPCFPQALPRCSAFHTLFKNQLTILPKYRELERIGAWYAPLDPK